MNSSVSNSFCGGILSPKGVSSDAIYGFSKILDLERMGREWNPLGPFGNNVQKVGMGIAQKTNYSINMGQNRGMNIGHPSMSMDQNPEQGNGNNGNNGINNPGSNGGIVNNGYSGKV